jgi:hypothetical protein
MRDLTVLTRLGFGLSALVGAMTGAATLPEAVRAGTYDVISCSATPSGGLLVGTDDAWHFATVDSAHIEDLRYCPVTPSLDLDGTYISGDGLIVWTRLNSDGAVKNGYGHWRFEAPAGTSIRRLRLARETGKQLNSWELYTRADDTLLARSNCTRTVDTPYCKQGGPDWAPEEWELLSPASSVAFGIACQNTTSDCATGATLHEAWGAIYQAKVTIQDTGVPTVSGSGGSLFSGGWKRGTVTATLDAASDATGIKEVQARIDGFSRGSVTLSCDFTRARPCDDLRAPVTVSVDTTKASDGLGTAAVGAIDAASNFAAARSETVRIDNTPPLAPMPISATSEVLTGADATVTWANPGGQAAPITTARWTVCGPSGCTTGSSPVSGAGGALPVRMDTHGVYVVKVSLEDAAGNHDARAQTAWTLTRTASPAPLPAPPTAPSPSANTPPTHPRTPQLRSPRMRLLRAPAVAADGRTISVRGTTAPEATGKVAVRVSARVAGRRRVVSRAAVLREGHFAARVRLPSARWSRAVVRIRYAGNDRVRAGTLTRAVRSHRG